LEVLRLVNRLVAGSVWLFDKQTSRESEKSSEGRAAHADSANGGS